MSSLLTTQVTPFGGFDLDLETQLSFNAKVFL